MFKINPIQTTDQLFNWFPWSKVTCVVFRQQQDTDGGTSPSTTPAAATTRRRSTLSKRRVTRMVIVVVAVFAVCWLPLHLTFVIQYSSTIVSTWLVLVKIPCTCLAYINSCLNPFLYAFLSHNFQRSVARRICSSSQQGAPVICRAGAID